jgi:hypothetical protein
MTIEQFWVRLISKKSPTVTLLLRELHRKIFAVACALFAVSWSSEISTRSPLFFEHTGNEKTDGRKKTREKTAKSQNAPIQKRAHTPPPALLHLYLCILLSLKHPPRNTECARLQRRECGAAVCKRTAELSREICFHECVSECRLRL